MNVDNVSILSKAEVSEHPSPVSPKPLLNIAIAFAAGLAGSIGLAFLLEHLDNTIKSEASLTDMLTTWESCSLDTVILSFSSWDVIDRPISLMTSSKMAGLLMMTLYVLIN